MHAVPWAVDGMILLHSQLAASYLAATILHQGLQEPILVR